MTTRDEDRFDLNRLRSALRTRDRQHGDMKLFKHVNGLAYTAKMFVGTDQACVINDAAFDFENVTFRGCEFTVDGPCDWGLLLYNVDALVVEHCWFHDFTAKKLDGHAAYIRAHGDVFFRHGLTQRCFGQGIQSAKRAAHHNGYECIDPARFSNHSIFRVEDWTFEDVSIPGGKHAGFALSFFAFQDDAGGPFYPVGQRVELIDVRLRHSIGGRVLVVQGGKYGHPSFFAKDVDVNYPDTEGAGELALSTFVPFFIVDGGSWTGGKVKLHVAPDDVVSISNVGGDSPLWVYEYERDDKGALVNPKLRKLSMREGYEHRLTSVAQANGGVS